jgi:hypothetical protein
MADGGSAYGPRSTESGIRRRSSFIGHSPFRHSPAVIGHRSSAIHVSGLDPGRDFGENHEGRRVRDAGRAARFVSLRASRPSHAMPRPTVLDQIRSLDPEADHERIVFLSCCYEFPFDTTRALEFALYRTYCVPSISALLDRTGEFRQRAQKRYDDTDLIISELTEWGYSSDRGRAALRRMNQIHGRFAIPNDDFLYVLSTFVFEPVRWNARFGWRPMCSEERLGLFHFWRAVGCRMNIKEIPETYEAFDRFNAAFERERFRFSETNRRVREATRDLFLSWFPAPLRPLARPAIYALMDDPLIEAFGFPGPSPIARRLVSGVLRLRARALRWLPPRRRPRLRTAMRHPSYPDGYRIDQLGPPEPSLTPDPIPSEGPTP